MNGSSRVQLRSQALGPAILKSRAGIYFFAEDSLRVLKGSRVSSTIEA